MPTHIETLQGAEKVFNTLLAKARTLLEVPAAIALVKAMDENHPYPQKVVALEEYIRVYSALRIVEGKGVYPSYELLAHMPLLYLLREHQHAEWEIATRPFYQETFELDDEAPGRLETTEL